jgi:hypothetical protein
MGLFASMTKLCENWYNESIGGWLRTNPDSREVLFKQISDKATKQAMFREFIKDLKANVVLPVEYWPTSRIIGLALKSGSSKAGEWNSWKL